MLLEKAFPSLLCWAIHCNIIEATHLLNRAGGILEPSLSSLTPGERQVGLKLLVPSLLVPRLWLLLKDTSVHWRPKQKERWVRWWAGLHMHLSARPYRFSKMN